MASNETLVECFDPTVSDNIPNSSMNAYLGLIVPIVGWIYVVLALMLYRWKYRMTLSLRNRDFTLTFLCILGLSYTFSVPLGNWIGLNQFPCSLFLTYNPVVFLFGFWPLIVRVILFYNRVHFNRLLAEKTFADYLENPDIKLVIDRKGSNVSQSSKGSETRKLRHFSKKKNHASMITFGSSNDDLSNNEKHAKDDLPKYLTRAKFFSSTKFGLSLVVIPSAIVAIYIGVSTRNVIGCSLASIRCVDNIGAGYFLLTLFSSLICAVIATWAFWKVRHEPDPREITSEVRTTVVFLAFFGLLWNILNTVDPGNVQQDGKLLWWIIIIPPMCVAITRLLLPAVYVVSDHKKHPEDNSFKALNNILSSDIGRQLFKAHLVTELSIENYYFWREATEWKAAYDAQSEEARLRRFRFLVETFVASDGFMRINIKHAFSESIMKVNNGECPLSLTVFDNAIRSTFLLMAFDSLPRFKQSAIYKEQYQSNESHYLPEGGW